MRPRIEQVRPSDKERFGWSSGQVEILATGSAPETVKTAAAPETAAQQMNRRIRRAAGKG